MTTAVHARTLVACAEQLRHLTNKVAYVLPVSDDGGSTAEVVRVLGGPAVGDIRSRCLRLADDSDEEVRLAAASTGASSRRGGKRRGSRGSACSSCLAGDVVEEYLCDDNQQRKWSPVAPW